MENNIGYKYQDVYKDILSKISDSTFDAGERLPGELELSKLYFCSRATIRKALLILECEGYVYKKRGQGTFVKVNKLDYNLNYLEGFTEQMLKSNRKPSSELLMIEKTDDVAVDVKQTLKLNGNDKVYRVKRLRYADEKIMAYEISNIRSDLCPDIQKYIDDNSSLYDVYEKVYGLKLKYGDVSLEAVLTDEEISEILDIKINSPVLLMNCSVYLENDEPLYHVLCYYVGERYAFTARQYR